MSRRSPRRIPSNTVGLKIFEATGPPPEGPVPTLRRVVIIGAGVAGLTAAHELAERGYEVTVYERRALGGKCRSIPVPNTARGDRVELPGEHGYRYVPGFYQHLPDTLARIPSLDDERSVWDHMVPQAGFLFARNGGREDLPVFSRFRGAVTRAFLRQARIALYQHFRALPPTQLLTFFTRLLVFMTSCEERRFGEWEYTTWWDFVRAERMSEEYKKLLVNGVTEHLIAARGELASARSIGTLGEAYIYSLMGRSTTGESGRVLDAPTSESWIEPWVTYLRSKGVRFVVGAGAKAFEVDQGRVASVIVSGPEQDRRVDGDWFVCAVPVEQAQLLLAGDVLAVDPSLARLALLRTEWMNGIQFYLRRQVPIINGPVAYVDSPWSLVSASETQWWNRDLPASYGDGGVRECLSVNIANFDQPGIIFGKPASKCTPDEIAIEVVAQMRAALEDTGRTVLPDEIIASWFLDPALRFDNGTMINDEPLFVNYAGSWDARPCATTAIPNLFLAGDYVRENLSAATMESANQTARLAANAILEASGSPAPPSRVFPAYDPPVLKALKRKDSDRFRSGLPHLLDRRAANEPS